MPTEPLSIQQLNLSGLLPEQQNAVVKLDLALTAPAPGGGATADFTAWPEFHNGVAAGLPNDIADDGFLIWRVLRNG